MQKAETSICLRRGVLAYWLVSVLGGWRVGVLGGWRVSVLGGWRVGPDSYRDWRVRWMEEKYKIINKKLNK